MGQAKLNVKAKAKKKGKAKKPGKKFPLTVVVDLDKDGRPDVVRVYQRKKSKNKVLVANVKLGSTKMRTRKKRKR